MEFPDSLSPSLTISSYHPSHLVGPLDGIWRLHRSYVCKSTSSDAVMCMGCLISLFNVISTLVGYFNAKAILLEEQ